MEQAGWMNEQADKDLEKVLRYRNLIYAIIDYLKKEKDHEGTTAVASPSDILDRVYGLAQDIPDVKERIVS